MKYARKMMVVPYSTPVGSSADAQNVNMSVALMKNIPNNDKNKLYNQSLSKLRELSETLRPEDKFKETVSKLIENIEEEVKKDNFDTEDINEIEKKELQENASKKVKDYSSKTNQEINSKKRSKKYLSRELKGLNIENIIKNDDKPYTRSQKLENIVNEVKADNALKKPTALKILPSAHDDEEEFNFELEPSFIDNALNTAINLSKIEDDNDKITTANEPKNLKHLTEVNKINDKQKITNLKEKIILDKKSINRDKNRNINNYDDDDEDDNDNFVDVDDNLDFDDNQKAAAVKINQNLQDLVNKSITEFGTDDVVKVLRNRSVRSIKQLKLRPKPYSPHPREKSKATTSLFTTKLK